MDIKSTNAGKEEKSADIQDAFDSLLFCEDNFVRQGYEEGLADGEKAGFQEGFELGIKKGTEIGTEIAFYRGFAKGCLAQLSSDSSILKDQLQLQVQLCQGAIQDQEIATNLEAVCQNIDSSFYKESDQKAIKALQRLVALIESFPAENLKDQDVLDLLNNIRAKFKQCCSILKVETSYSNSATQLSF